jgi:hypothetical protein
MDTILSNQVPSHPSIDLVAEGMWRIAAGESCPECWEVLFEHQKGGGEVAPLALSDTG